MSLLVNLLSKNNWDEPQGDKDIPPTLARSHGLSAKKQSPIKRYVIIAGLSVAIAVAGLVMNSMLKRMALAKRMKIPLPAASPVAPPQPVAVQAPQQAAPPQQAPAAPPSQATEQPKDKPEAALAARSLPKPKPRKHIAARSTKREKPFVLKMPEKVSPKQQYSNLEPQRITASPQKVDTEARGAFLYAARSAEQSGDWGGALVNYRKAHEIDPNNYKILSNSAAALNNLGMFDEGAIEARRALDRRSDYIPAMINYAIACSSKGNNEEALRYFSIAYNTDPSNRNLAVNLGILQERMGKLDEARSTYRRLAEAGDPLALMGMGRIAERRGNRAEAVNNYRQIMAIKDISPALRKEAKQKLARLEE